MVAKGKSVKRKPSALTRAKARARAKRERQLGRRQLAMPDRRYGLVYCDPPWRFEPYSRLTGLDRAADNHYPTLTIEQIAAIRVPAARDCVLFLWATSPMLCAALEVMAAWDFSYRSQLVWVKPQLGTGYWVRARHELLLIGVRGEVPAPSPGTQFSSVIEASRGRHSAKPEEVRELIERMFPTLPRIELFARQRIDGWDAWGNELEPVAESLDAIDEITA